VAHWVCITDERIPTRPSPPRNNLPKKTPGWYNVVCLEKEGGGDNFRKQVAEGRLQKYCQNTFQKKGEAWQPRKLKT